MLAFDTSCQLGALLGIQVVGVGVDEPRVPWELTNEKLCARITEAYRVRNMARASGDAAEAVLVEEAMDWFLDLLSERMRGQELDEGR
ncbi:hypothetical protein [Saccharopolyspora phatthalungensis]|uniref:Uncharacterized protein n=1 Tax=Saccharopolyspora phatthalungensis TaxID=664693 RepID=A0A840QFW9_9PSEU|nr:hypothetical protein [Saccharopolyspora phatthalungensis]MBB5156023.1 hypothetical protein [Saccharopolyspora phatthalungensis]